VIEQLNGVPIQQAKILLHARIEENAAKDDWNLCLWCERIAVDVPTEKGPSAMETWWLQSGRSSEEYRQRLKSDRKISEKILEDLENIAYPVKENLKFLSLANKL